MTITCFSSPFSVTFMLLSCWEIWGFQPSYSRSWLRVWPANHMSSREKTLNICVVAIVMVIAFGGPIAFQGFVEISIFEIQYEAKIHSQTGSEMDRAVVLSVSGASATLHVPFIFLSRSFHFPFMFLSLVLMSIHFPFIFLSFSFQCAFMSSHLPFICTHVPFILHSCPFISFLQLWKWLDGLARELSATNGSR